MQPMIRAIDVAKRFQLGASPSSYATLRESLTNAVRSRFAGGRAADDAQILHALSGVSFDIAAGEVVGIIGRNGAGKSTLLKVLSRITQPTSGRVELYGRVASLLEVGTGFHPELTGRENIFLSGAILGMSRAEIRRQFDAIVAFSEIERFIDTPAKRYSSGMYLRLAFAVAAHLDPEILLVDEVLAVGDASFQRKCLDKMEDVHQSGRTVIFVSHNMPAITRLCPRTILLEAGRVLFDGPSHEAVRHYLASGLGSAAERAWSDAESAPGNRIARLRSVRVRNDHGDVSESIDIRRPVAIEMEYDVLEDGHVLVPNYHFFNEEGTYVFVVSEPGLWHRKPRSKGRHRSTAWVPGNLLAEGTFLVGAALSTMDPVEVHFYEREAVAFQVYDTLEGDSARGDYGGPIPGPVRPLLEWTSEIVSG